MTEEYCHISPKCAPRLVLDTSDSKEDLFLYSRGNSSQSFQLQEYKNGYYLIVNAQTEKVLTVQGESADYGSKIVLDENVYSDAQLWRPCETESGYYCFLSKLNEDYCLDVDNAGSSNFTKIQLWSVNRTNAQLFRLIPDSVLPQGEVDMSDLSCEELYSLISEEYDEDLDYFIGYEDEAFFELQERADVCEDDEAMYYLGCAYRDYLVEPEWVDYEDFDNEEKSMEYFQRSADAGNSKAIEIIEEDDDDDDDYDYNYDNYSSGSSYHSSYTYKPEMGDVVEINSNVHRCWTDLFDKDSREKLPDEFHELLWVLTDSDSNKNKFELTHFYTETVTEGFLFKKKVEKQRSISLVLTRQDFTKVGNIYDED